MLVAKDWIRQESMGQALSKCVSHCDGRFVSLLTTPLLCSELFFRIRPLQIVLIGLQMAASNRVLPHFPRRRCSWSGVVWCGYVAMPHQNNKGGRDSHPSQSMSLCDYHISGRRWRVLDASCAQPSRKSRQRVFNVTQYWKFVAKQMSTQFPHLCLS